MNNPFDRWRELRATKQNRPADMICGNCGEIQGATVFNAHWAQCIGVPQRQVTNKMYVCPGCRTAITYPAQACQCWSPVLMSIEAESFLRRQARQKGQ